MKGYDETTYGERVASTYDRWYQADEKVAAAVAFLARLAGSGPALELGIGTGRIAIPLSESGVEMHGIDASPAMVEQLRVKNGGQAIPVIFGNFAELSLNAEFPLIFVAFNTL